MSTGIETLAAVLEAPGKGFVVETVQLGAPGPSEVLVRIEASGVCHSDWNAASGASATPMPAVLGHEGGGVVEGVGSAVTRVAVGDKVVLSWLPTCGACPACMRGDLSLCANSMTEMGNGALPSGEIRLSRGGSPLYHYSYLSTFARHSVVDERCCVVLPQDADLEVACLVGCAVTTGVGAVFNKAKVGPGSSVIIFGGGGVGLSALMAARYAGATTVVVVDTVASKRELANELGATATVDGHDANLVEELRELCGGGADYAFEAAGLPSLATIAFDSIRPGGMVVLVGVPADGEMVSFTGNVLVRSEKIVTGTFYGSARPALDMPLIMRLYAGGKFPLDRFVSERYPLGGINDAFAAMLEGRVVRAVLKPWEGDS
ncbi:MAG: zinc-binding dehydrogenase [Acidimicrobiales bacterium]